MGQYMVIIILHPHWFLVLSMLQELRVSLKFEDVHTGMLTGRKQKIGDFSVIENPGELVITK